MNCFQFFNFRDYSQGVRLLIVTLLVVNCFQFFNFRDYSQDSRDFPTPYPRCELLSVL
ncbi:Hypothetical protein I595_1 [Croceitalea dokdonensis DOKDO 023]|uniref:Uncharacterized protein n=1 Tax=Croceitalea dokdonensis DOKDO 023 TaxID=1300341 RepID=A0A0P7B1P7_9FLAO|nr:Hypothetical protein I595_1 [Croceitalea dokdonensis DOKDO 023]